MERKFDAIQVLRNTQLFSVIYRHGISKSDEIYDKVKECLELGADINAVDRNNDGNTMLHEAVSQKSKDLVSFLLGNGARTDVINEEGLTAVELARHLKCDDIMKLFEKHSQREVGGDLVQSTSPMYDELGLSNKCFWSVLYANSKAKYIEIDRRVSDQPILRDADFYRTVEMFDNLILVDVLISDGTLVDDSVVLKHLTSIKNPIIMQCRSSSVNKVYFKEFQRRPNLVELMSDQMEVDEDYFLGRLKAKETFGISLILEGLMQNVFGKFSSESHKSLLDLCFWEKRYNGFRLIDYAVEHNHLLAVRWLRLDRYKVQWNPFVHPVQTMGREMLAALLKVEFPIPMGKIQLSADVVGYFGKRKDDFFKDAAYNDRQDLVEFLLQCTNEFDYKHLIKSFVNSKRYDIALAIIKADGLYPDNFDSCKLDVSIPGGKEFVEFFCKRNQLHDLISHSSLENVKDHFGKLFKSKSYLSTKNESAVAAALRNKKFDIYRYLLSQKVDFKDNTERKLLSQSEFSEEFRLREQMIESISQTGDSAIDYLLSKTRMPSFQLEDRHKQLIRRYYERLNEIPEISIIFAVVQYSDYLDIIFDFDHESTTEMEPTTGNSLELYYPALGRIYIGAKLDEKRLLGVIAHELTHLAMQLVYSNQCKPYFRSDIVEELTFNKIVAETSRLPNVDPVIGVVFNTDYYQTDVRSAEIIVRVNHMLAMYGLENGEAILRIQVPRLWEYYHSKVMPQCQAFVRETHRIKMRSSVEILSDMNESFIRMKSQIDLEDFLQSGEKRLIYFSTESTRWITIQICQNFKDMKRIESQFTFLNLEDLRDFKCGSTDSSNVFILTISPNSNSKVDQESNVVADWVNHMLQNLNTKLVLVLSDKCVDVIKTQLQCVVPDEIVEMLSDKSLDLDLEKFLSSDEQLFIYKTKTPRLSMIGVYQILKMWFCSCENSIVILKLKDLLDTYIQFKQVITSVACKIIVLESDSNYDGIPEESLTRFKSVVIESGKKFIVVTPVTADHLLDPRDKEIQQSKIVNSVSLNDLTVDSIELLLDRDVRFQGGIVKLKDLVDISFYDVVDEDTIIKLANEEVIDIGKELPILETFYVPRTLKYGAKIKSKWVKRYLQNQKLSDDIGVSIQSKCAEVISLDSTNKKNFRELCEQHPGIDVHWLKRKSDFYISKLTLTTLKEFRKIPHFSSTDYSSDDSGDDLSDESGLDSLPDVFKSFLGLESTNDLNEDSLVDQMDEHQLVIVSDVAGMGKTALLTHIARLLKEKYPSLWIIKINLNLYTKVLDEEAETSSFEGDEIEEALDFFVNKLMESRNETKLETNFEKILIKQYIKGSGDIVILFDGFDELKEVQQNVVIKLVKSLQRTKVKQMWVTTRPHMKDKLENELLQFSHALVPFTEKNQLDFLTKFWMSKLENEIKVRKFAEVLLKRFNEFIIDKERELTGIPLQTMMLAEAFESDCKAFHNSKDKEPSFTDKLNFFCLYERFITKKFDICQFLKSGLERPTLLTDSNRKRLYSEILKNHQLLALVALFNKQARDIVLDSVTTTDDIDEMAVDLFPYGIINKVADGQPQFIHRTFAEYFAAEFIIDKLMKRRSEEKFIKFVLCNILSEYDLNVVCRTFINMRISKINDNSANFSQQIKTLVNNSDWNPWTSMSVATKEANLNIFKFLFEHLIDADCCDVKCDGAASLFFTAIETGCLQVTKSLLEMGFDVNYVSLQDGLRCTPLSEAARRGNADICKLLLENGADCNIQLVPHILDSKLYTWKGCTALHIACMEVRKSVVSMLLEYNADVNATDDDQMTPLHAAAAASGSVDIVAELIDHKADINAVNVSGYTPLCEAIRFKRDEVVDYMVTLEGLDVNAANGCGLTPLHVAAVCENNKIVRILIERGANVNALVDLDKARTEHDSVTESIIECNCPAITPLHLARASGKEDVAAVLVEYGATNDHPKL